jgi:four helix bundle protein
VTTALRKLPFKDSSRVLPGDSFARVVGSTLATRSSMIQIVSYRDLIAWQKAMDLVVLVYRLTEHFPRREWYGGLAAVMRKSSVSIPSNISEGHSQRHGAYVRHLWIAVGSRSELQTQSELSFRLNYIVGEDRLEVEGLLDQVGKLVRGLLNSVEDSVVRQSINPNPESPIPNPQSLTPAPP